MGGAKQHLSSKAHLSFKVGNKQRREGLHIRRKKASDNIKRDERFRRRREEDADPRLREQRLKENVPLTIERKRVWDQVDNDTGDGLGLSVDVESLRKKQRLEEERAATEEEEAPVDDSDEERDSMIESASEDDVVAPIEFKEAAKTRTPTERATSPVRSTTSTNLECTPEALAAKFPTLFSTDSAPTPKVLITTGINGTLHKEAESLTNLFPNSVYIPRSSHRYSHRFSVREISSFASNRNFTAVLVLKEDLKRPTGLTVVHLPAGPTFHFKLVLNGFRTPLGLLVAHLFRTLFPAVPQPQGRQVVTAHNQRDYIFMRRHRYVFRDKRETEKSVTGPDGKEVKGVEGIRTGLQELGPRFTMKLRRVDKGIQRGSGQEWEWKVRMEKQRTKFQL